MFIVGKSFFSENLSKFNIKTIAPLCVIHIPSKICHNLWSSSETLSTKPLEIDNFYGRNGQSHILSSVFELKLINQTKHLLCNIYILTLTVHNTAMSWYS